MKLREDKCAYLQIERSKIVQIEEPIFSKQYLLITIKLVTVVYLGINENIEFVGPINKDNIKRTH